MFENDKGLRTKITSSPSLLPSTGKNWIDLLNIFQYIKKFFKFSLLVHSSQLLWSYG